MSRCFIRAPVDSMVGFVRQTTRSAGPPARSMARRMTSQVSAMQRFARGWGEMTTALRPFTEMRALYIVVEVGFVVGTMPATTPTGVATSWTPLCSSRLTKPTVRSSLMESQTPSDPKRFLRIL